MAECDDNARDVDSDMQIPSEDEESSAASVDCNTVNEPSDVQQLLKQFMDLSLKIAASENASERELIKNDENMASHMLDEKMRLLCSVGTPTSNQLATVGNIDAMQKQLIEMFENIKTDEEECVNAYSSHCDGALKAVEENAELQEFDEITTMSYSALVDLHNKTQEEEKALQATCEKNLERCRAQKALYEAKYKLLLKEIDQFEKLELEATEELEQLQFDLEDQYRNKNKYA